MGKCDCGAETDWRETGSTWLCVSCRSEEIEKASGELKDGLKKMAQAMAGLQRLKVDTASLSGLIESLKREINRLEASNS